PVQPPAAVTTMPVQPPAMVTATPVRPSTIATGAPVKPPASATGTPVAPSAMATATSVQPPATVPGAHVHHPAAGGTPVRRYAPANLKAYFVYPTSGAHVSGTSVIRLGVVNVGGGPAGLETADTCYYHLLIDAPLPPPDQPIPNDFHYLHFGAGQTEARV